VEDDAMARWHHRDLFVTPSIGYITSHGFDAEGTQHLFYVGYNDTGDGDREIYELWWAGGGPGHANDLTKASGAPVASFNMLASHVFNAEGTQHVFYASADDLHIYELWWRGPEAPHSGNLTAAAGLAPGFTLLGGLTSHVFNAEGTQHVFYVSHDKHIRELWWKGDEKPRPRDLTALSGRELLPSGRLTSHVFDAEGTHHVFYPAAGHIIELWWRHGDNVHVNVRDLTDVSGAPLAASSPTTHVVNAPTSHVFNAEGTQHVFYVSDDQHIRELWWRGSDEIPHPEDLTRRSGGPLPWNGLTRLASHVFDAEGSQHVFYREDNGHIIELWWMGGEAPHPEDLTDRSGGAPLAAGVGSLEGFGPEGQDAISHVFNAEGSQHVFYTSTHGRIIELWSER
jgi:hypothetical protein